MFPSISPGVQPDLSHASHGIYGNAIPSVSFPSSESMSDVDTTHVVPILLPPCYGLETDWKTICVESGAGSVRIDGFFKVGKESWIYESCENPQKTIHRSD